MKMNKVALALAIASGLGTISSAQAAINLAGTSTNPVKFASEISLQNVGPFVNGTSDDLVVNIPVISGYQTNSNNDLYIKVALSGGAEFHGDPKLICNLTAGQTSADVTNKTNTSVTFSLATGYTIHTTPASAVCALKVVTNGSSGNTGYYDVTTKADQNMSALIEYQAGLTNKSTAVDGTFITFTASLGVSASTRAISQTAADATIDVQAASTKFTNDTLVTQTTAFVGSFAYNNLASARSPGASANVSASDVISSASVTISSPTLAGINNIALRTAAAAAACAGGEIASQAPSGSSVTFNGIAPANLEAGMDVCISVDGTTTMEAGLFTVSVSGEVISSAAPVFGGDHNLYKLEKNGSAHQVLNIPPAGKDDAAYIRIYNVSGFSGTVLGTMRDQAGALIGTAGVEVAKLDKGQVKVINADDLVTLFGDWTGRSRLFLEADIDELRVQSLMRSGGVLENMSGRAID